MASSKDVIKQRILSTKENLGNRESFNLIKRFQKDLGTGLLISPEYAQAQADICGFCGETMLFKKKAKYEAIVNGIKHNFGIYHEECVQKMLSGETN